MKRVIYAITISLLLAACSDEVTLTPGISFLTPKPEVYEETAIFRVIGQPFSSADSLRIPVVFGGDAQRGTDYDISADHFMLSSDRLTDSIVVYTKQLGTGRTLNLNLQIPEGFVSGKYTTSELPLQDKYGYLTFESSKSFAADTTNYVVSLCDSTGMTKALTKGTPIGFTVNTEKSTAVEGVDYKFVSPTPLIIAAGTGYANFSIVPLASTPTAGKDKIVLNLNADDRFEAGQYPELEITLTRKELKSLEGYWIISSVNTDSLYFDNIWGSECSGYDLLPKLNESDLMEFTFNRAKFHPLFNSDFRYYFSGESEMSLGPQMDITDPNGEVKSVQLFSLDNTNRYFSAEEVSEDKVSYIGLYPYTDVETQSAMLELYVLDHTSRSFMPELETGGRYAAEKPVAATPGLYVSATFKKY